MSPATKDAEQITVALVVLGDFNPAIFHPLWFSANGLLPPEETEAADIKMILKEIAAFSVGPFQIQVDENRLGLTTAESPQWITLKDLAIGILSILEHTPLRAIGLNVDCVFGFESEEEWHEFGDQIAPKNGWRRILDVDRPGLQQLVIEGRRSNCSADRIRLNVQPSGPRKVRIAINQHYQLDARCTQTVDSVKERNLAAVSLLRDDFPPFVDFANKTARDMMMPGFFAAE